MYTVPSVCDPDMDKEDEVFTSGPVNRSVIKWQSPLNEFFMILLK